MSGGTFDFKDSCALWEIFGYEVYPCFPSEKESEDYRKLVRKKNRFEDFEISELIYDVFCLIRAYDWYNAGDTDEEDYRKEVDWFKNKWIRGDATERAIKLFGTRVEDYTEEIMNTFRNMFNYKGEEEDE